MAFLLQFIIPAIIAILFFAFTKKTITLKEFMTHMALQCVVAGAAATIIYQKNTWDNEVINGQVTSKESARVSCSHSYRCHCYQSCSGTGTNRSCHEVCSTCYDHSYDVNWYVHSNVGSTTISRVNRQGTTQPPRWTQVKIGEPFSLTKSFTNYIKAAPDTIFRHQGLTRKFQTSLPQYPSEIYDYYRVDRFLSIGKRLTDEKNWNADLSEINKELGPNKKVNMATVVAFNLPRDYFYALEQHWIGGKKNDVILVVGVNDNLEITWVEIMGWTNNSLFKIKIRDRIMDQKTLVRENVLSVLKEEVKLGYVSKPMKDFEYLESSITPSVAEWMISLFIGIIVSVMTGVFLHKHDLFDEERF